jgi:hypothetical protein
MLSMLAARAWGRGISAVPPPRGTVTGGYPLGQVVVGDLDWDSFGLNEDEWIQHVGIFGRSGSGKTNLGFLILRELAAKGKPFLVFDWKRNYRDLLGLEGFSGQRVFTVGREIAPFRFNPLCPPPGTDPEVFLKKLIEIMMHVYWLGDGVAYLLQMAIDSVYRQRGVYGGGCDRFPTLFDVRDWLKAYKAKGREAQWMDSTRRVIETLCFGQIGKVVNTGSNEEFRQLLSSPAVLQACHRHRGGPPLPAQAQRIQGDHRGCDFEGDPGTRGGDHLSGPASIPDFHALSGQLLLHDCHEPEARQRHLSHREGHAAERRAEGLPGETALASSSSVSTPTGRTRIVRLTDAAVRALGADESIISGAHQESAEHWFWKTKLAEQLRNAGYAVEIERYGADLAFERDGKRTAVEIETGKSDVEANIRRDLQHGFDHVVLVWLHGPSPTSPRERVRSLTLAEFLVALPSRCNTKSNLTA